MNPTMLLSIVLILGGVPQGQSKEEAVAESRRLADLGEKFYLREKDNRAISSLKKAIKLDPGCIKARYILADIWADRDDIEGAMEEYRKVLELDPKHVGALDKLGLLQLEIGQGEEAIKTFQRALEIQSTDVDARTHLGEALETLGRLDKAIEQYNGARSRTPPGSARRSIPGRTLRRLRGY